MSNFSKRETVELILVTICAIIVFVLLFMFGPKKGEVIVINCTWSEISPDFTEKMRTACRQARIENNQKDLQKPK